MLSDRRGVAEKKGQCKIARARSGEEDSSGKQPRVIFASDLGILLCWSLEQATIKGIVYSR